MDKRLENAAGRMFVNRITGQALAKESGYNPSYVSEVLHGKRGTEETIQRILDALTRLEQRGAESAEGTDGAVPVAETTEQDEAGDEHDR